MILMLYLNISIIYAGVTSESNDNIYTILYEDIKLYCTKLNLRRFKLVNNERYVYKQISYYCNYGCSNNLCIILELHLFRFLFHKRSTLCA